MRIQRSVALGLVILIVHLCAGIWLALAATDPLGNKNQLPDALEQTVGQLRAGLETDGFAVARGYWTLWGAEDCKYPIQTLGYCYGNNPAAPYLIAVVPTWKDEYVDQRFHHIIDEPQRNMSPTYRLSPREALIVVAQMPPPARYFGMGSNVFTREAAFNPADPIFPKVAADSQLQNILFGVSPDPDRRMLISSIGNSINNVVIANKTGQSPWDKPAYMIITSDMGMAAQMTEALVNAGASASDIFTEPVAPELVKLGLNRSADDLITYIRYALPDDKAAGNQWRNNPPLTILRVRDMTSTQYANPFAVPAYTARTAHFDEKTQLNGDFLALQEAVRGVWAQPKASIVPFNSAYKLLDLQGQHCLGWPDTTRGPMDCLGDSQDTDYQLSGSTQIDNGEVIAIVGVLSTETGNATYSSLSVNWFPQLVGVANVDDTDLKGTAAQFAGALQNSDREFYVYYYARDCSGLPHCIQITRQQVPKGGTIKVIQRNYINPGTSTGALPAQILDPELIVLNGKDRPALQ